MSNFLENECCGAGPHTGPNEVRLRPLGGDANLILCQACWARENRYCYERGKETKAPENWPQHDWNKAEVYKQEDAQ